MSQSKRIPPSGKAPVEPDWADLAAYLENRPAAILESVPKHITDPSAHWDTTHFDLATLSAPVSHFHFVALLDTEDAVGNDGNRWSLSIQTGEDASVTLNTVPGAEGKPGRIVLENEATTRTKAPSAVVISAPCSIFTARVCDVLDIIISEKRDEYVFTTGGAGGRWWMNEVVRDMFEHGYLQGFYLDAIRKHLVHYWPSPVGSPPILRQWAVGKFCE